jgi:hypothetical protein
MFMMNHPLEGKLEAEIKCMDIHAMNQLYGTDPVFIFDPNDKRNRPVRGYQDNALIYWDLYPENLRNLFTQAFTIGIQSPNRRVTENKWLETFANLMSGIVSCPNCGAEVFYDEAKEKNGAAHICWSCQQTVPVPAKIVIGRSTILLTASTKLYRHHLYGDYDMERVAASVVQNPKNPNLWGIRNEDQVNWTYEKADGTQIPVAIGRSAAIAAGAKIHFGRQIGEFR